MRIGHPGGYSSQGPTGFLSGPGRRSADNKKTGEEALGVGQLEKLIWITC